MPKTYLIIGATRGIGLEFTSQLLSLGHIVIATARSPTAPIASSSKPSKTSNLWTLTGTPNGRNLTILECDVSDESSIKSFSEEVRKLGRRGGVLERGVIDVVVVNAGVLEYPGRIGEISFSAFSHHLHPNTIGPLLTASHLLALSYPSFLPQSSPFQSFSHDPSSNTLSPTSSSFVLPPPISPLSPTYPQTPIHIKTLVFTSSDSGSTTNFRSFEDGFGAYAVSKAGLNMGLRHLAAELHRKNTSVASPQSQTREQRKTVILALHPGEVSTDMAANVSLDWEVEGIISPEESIRCMLKVIEEKGYGGEDEGGVRSAKSEGRKREDGEASFWTWEGNRYPW